MGSGRSHNELCLHQLHFYSTFLKFSLQLCKSMKTYATIGPMLLSFTFKNLGLDREFRCGGGGDVYVSTVCIL